MRINIRLLCCAFAASLLGILALSASPSVAALPWWNLNTSVRPATIPAGGEGTIVAYAINLGNATTSGPSRISVTLPEGVSIVEHAGLPPVSFYAFSGQGDLAKEKVSGKPLELCRTIASRVTCSTETQNPELAGLEFIKPLAPYEFIEIRIGIKDEGATADAKFQVEVAGGGATTATRSVALPVGPNATVFGGETYALLPETEGGTVDTVAGSHPYQLTSIFNLNQTREYAFPHSTTEIIEAPAPPRNIAFKLPAGQIGNATASPQCSEADFSALLTGGANRCPPATAIGVAVITFDETTNLAPINAPVPLFNLTPAFGEPARFGFEILGNPVILDTSVRSGAGEDYGVTVSISDITELVNFVSSTVTFWGTPGDPSHDNARGWECLVGGHWKNEAVLGPCKAQDQEKPPAFLTLPANCSAPFATTVEAESWTDPTKPVASVSSPLAYSLHDASGEPLGLTGCNQLSFNPIVSAEPTTDSVSSPSGLNFNLNFDDEGLASESGRAQSQVKNTVVTLPEGLTINPSAGVGLGGCTPEDYERETISSIPGEGCPNNSKLGTVEIESSLLAQKIHGSIYIAQPYDNPFDSLVALYVVAKNPETGVLIKQPGKVEPNPVTGQLTTSFENIPQLPFSHFNFHFREGQQAPLVSPSLCGTYSTVAELSPWSAPSNTVTEGSSFAITKGFDGGVCPSGGLPPFKPGIESGLLNNNAGAYSSFYLHLTRTDAEQEIAGFSTNLPSGLTGNLSGIPFCPDADIEVARHNTGAQEEASPSCPAASQIGHTLVGTGVGAVLAYVPGKIYLAGPFHGAPFSLVAVTSAVVGPFDLGTVVLRFGLSIDPTTARVSVEPTSSEPIPTIIDGIVTHVRDIRVYIDRHDFTLNPTSCNALSIASTLTSDHSQTSTVTSPFQASNCQALAFKPGFKVSTSGKTSRIKGASLSVKLTYPSAPQGTQANIAKVKVDLPKQLPSRLTTLQKACPDNVFNVNPANCPAASIVGHAKATTPLIPDPLIGPAYFVSHGGAKFPELIVVLQGYGVTIDLHGETFISKAGITSSTFRAVPDQPVGSFEITLPQGTDSALAANGNLCKAKLTMPTVFVAQNGKEQRQATKITVTGCPKVKKKPKKINGRKIAKHHKVTTSHGKKK
jgi:hypothetical protein